MRGHVADFVLASGQRHLQAWITRVTATRSPATVRNVHRVFSLLLKTAMKDGRIGRNLSDDVNLRHRIRVAPRISLNAPSSKNAAGCSLC
jgi:hypothetical protein